LDLKAAAKSLTRTRETQIDSAVPDCAITPLLRHKNNSSTEEEGQIALAAESGFEAEQVAKIRIMSRWEKQASLA
jgi:hypothetical protein